MTINFRISFPIMKRMSVGSLIFLEKFTSGLFFMPEWNLTDTIARLGRLQAAVSIQFEVNQQCARIPPADFVEAVQKTNFLLHSTDLSADWHIPQFRRKVVPPAWVSQILELRKNPQSLPTEIMCITQLALETWADMSQADILSRISRPGKRFVAALKRSRLLSKHLERFVELASLDNCNLPHLISPSWSPTHSCITADCACQCATLGFTSYLQGSQPSSHRHPTTLA